FQYLADNFSRKHFFLILSCCFIYHKKTCTHGQLIQFKIVIGKIPLLEAWHSDLSVAAFLQNLILGIKQFFSLSLDKISIETKSGKLIKTLASGLFVINQNQSSRLTKVLLHKSSIRSDKLSLMIISHFSAVEYFLFLFSLIFHFNKENLLPHAVSNIKSEEIIINTETSFHNEFEVKVDDHKTIDFPLHLKIIRHAVKINAPENFWALNPVSVSDKEVIRTHNLPDEKEVNKYYKKHLPFFSVASEERFKDLFLQLRNDADISSLYLVLMMLSTLLASFGLFANSAAVVIGAMLLAPLMSPIISFSMGLLRDDKKILISSLIKILLGIVLALSASSILTLLLPQVELSNEIKARIHPNLIDLGVAIFSGIAAAYTKAHKELLNNLAGVAIAVALVPPLAVVGIGLGRGEAYVFEGALLLFMTNLIGITLSAIITFQFLGFSNTVKRKKNVLLIFSLLMILSYPLYRTYTDSILSYQLTKNLIDETIIINQQSIQIEQASIEYLNNLKIIDITIVLKKPLNDDELNLLKQKINRRFSSSYQIRVSMKFIL
ncbi:MAG: TIGR00341 family protein, partial [gamma proteobacterium symbiont of Bathyaustriella thionipta]|nr:TIGR00341 family protein [gamma proteobacterium symbiont of Bathyaustriella thionipta]MCU7951269.1 TIGR00341 family protein [gamma proteobacterium symbiont of Bathyaustriella thionipta]MCU7953521.1 TIGR00341 family protein [gamma proteobacterium symbiont of Bathyaustriella thionipta]MCU7957802.1 TIGR00341 family protein [gamma proteobacterium symbiont of Bathyaustriella thionipta]MCU7967305.1 TIGR00341 family protein [gamma proteobacterium symbiont of Bathyaustriella thionipta]